MTETHLRPAHLTLSDQSDRLRGQINDNPLEYLELCLLPPWKPE